MRTPPTPHQIKTARHNAGLSQPELAARMLNASPAELERFKDFEQVLRQIRNWESGRRIPDRTNTTRLHTALDTLPDG